MTGFSFAGSTGFGGSFGASFGVGVGATGTSLISSDLLSFSARVTSAVNGVTPLALAFTTCGPGSASIATFHAALAIGSSSSSTTVSLVCPRAARG